MPVIDLKVPRAATAHPRRAGVLNAEPGGGYAQRCAADPNTAHLGNVILAQATKVRRAPCEPHPARVAQHRGRCGGAGAGRLARSLCTSAAPTTARPPVILAADGRCSRPRNSRPRALAPAHGARPRLGAARQRCALEDDAEGLPPLPAGRPADLPPFAQGRSEEPTARIGSGILIARKDSSPRLNILFCVPFAIMPYEPRAVQIGGSLASMPATR